MLKGTQISQIANAVSQEVDLIVGGQVVLKASNTYLGTTAGTSGVVKIPTGVNFVDEDSDDRLKHNEVDITGALELIRQLRPQKYDLGHSPGPYTRKAGFIAQHVQQIDELIYTVHYSGGYYSLNYKDLFVHAVAATKELDAIVQQQAALIEQLSARVAALE